MIRIGVICPSEIASRRFMPALLEKKEFIFSGVAVPTADEYFGFKHGDMEGVISCELAKAEEIISKFGGKLYRSYEEIVLSPDIDALYIPLPPALHYKWAKLSLENDKHVLIEKPATLNSGQTRELVSIASARSLALHENYMFVFHSQINQINSIINNGELGDIRLFRVSFGFPRRESNDFRYNKELGGGALYDAGGYTIKYASMVLGKSAKIEYANMNYINDFSVDVFGSGAMANDNGITVQFAFGMDNCYRCDLEIWGSKGILTTDRILTAPVGFVPNAKIKKANTEEKVVLKADDTFGNSIKFFNECIGNHDTRNESYENIMRQASLADEFIALANREKQIFGNV